LSTELAAHDVSNYTYSILAYAAEKLSAANLHRLEAVFGHPLFDTAFSFMPAATASQYNAMAPYPAIPLSANWATLNPSLAASAPHDGDLYLYDLLLNEKTASAGETTTVALAHVSRYANARIKNLAVVAIVLTLAFGALQIYDSPSMQALGTKIGDWLWLSTLNAPNNPNSGFGFTRVIVSIPNLGNITPPAIDTGPVPDMPAIEGDDTENDATGGCPNNVCPV
jgi:hypothetical protein